MLQFFKETGNCVNAHTLLLETELKLHRVNSLPVNELVCGAWQIGGIIKHRVYLWQSREQQPPSPATLQVAWRAKCLQIGRKTPC